MAIKVIKHGQTRYTAICPRCGCEFEYDLDDLDIGNHVDCPDCGYTYYHPINYPNKPYWPSTPGWPYPEAIPCTPYIPDDYPNPIIKPNVIWNADPCEGCLWHEEEKKNPHRIIVGDTPCTWCSKRCPTVISGNEESPLLKWANKQPLGEPPTVTLNGGLSIVDDKTYPQDCVTETFTQFSPEDIDLPQ